MKTISQYMQQPMHVQNSSFDITMTYPPMNLAVQKQRVKGASRRGGETSE